MTFRSGREAEYDLVLVAEGVDSTTRELLFGGEDQPRWMDITIAYFTIPKIATDVTDSRWYKAPGGRVIFLRPDRHGETRAVLMQQHEVRNAEQRSTEDAKAWLKSAFQDAGLEAPRVLARLEQADDLYFEVLRQVKLYRWSSGRVALTSCARFENELYDLFVHAFARIWIQIRLVPRRKQSIVDSLLHPRIHRWCFIRNSRQDRVLQDQSSLL